MPFDPTPISDPRVARDGDTLVITWKTSASGSTTQVYIDRRLAWSGTATRATFPWPQSPIDVEIGVVPPSEAGVDFSASLSGGVAERAELVWLGGTYLSPTLASFKVYGPPAPNGPVDYSRPLATVPAYQFNQDDGYGLGGYGQGGYGHAASSYEWTSDVLRPGTWTFAVMPVDDAGNMPSMASTVAVTIDGPPNPPAIDPAGRRLEYAYDPSTRRALLTWLPSPP